MSGRNVKSYGTLGYYVNLNKKENSLLTTPEYEILYQKAYSKNKKNNFNFVFEISSHSISQKRIKNIPIDVAALTNITHDHLDYHKTFSNYKKTKFSLFLNHLKKNNVAVLNDQIHDIKKLKNILNKRKIRIITYGLKKSNIYVYKLKNEFLLKIFDREYCVKNLTLNKFELENLSCSIACCIGVGIEKQQIINSITKLKSAKGRLQKAGKLPNRSIVYVDYAHTPNALKNILIETSKHNKLPNVVFGCGGDRDTIKRAKMGYIANKFASKIYITDDNPRNENPSRIRKSIIIKCPKAKEIPNRRIAIKTAINELNNEEVLIIAGKGHENKQYFGKKILNFDDLKVAKHYLNKRKQKC